MAPVTSRPPHHRQPHGRGRARASASGYKVLMTEAQEASYTAAASERVLSVLCPPAEPVLCFQTNSRDDAGSGPPQLHPSGGRPGAGVGRSV